MNTQIQLNFTYNAFISYSREDNEWANKLSEDLGKTGIKLFKDDRIPVGDKWKEEIQNALRISQHLIVLWSKESIKNDSYVNEEVICFREEKNRYLNNNRKIIPIVLEKVEENRHYKETLNEFQGIIIDDILKTEAYKVGVNSIDKYKWLRVIRKVKDSIIGMEHDNYIPVLILTTTKDRLSGIDFKKPLEEVPKRPCLETLLDKFNISRNSFIDCYGKKRMDWRPFGSNRDILSILNGIKDEILDIFEYKKKNVIFDWDLIDDELWSDANSIKNQINVKFINKLSVILIDPFSIYDPLVASMLNDNCLQCFGNKQSIIMIFPPFPKPKHYICLKNYIELKDHLHKCFYEPWWLTQPRVRRAQCEAQIGDEHDAKKLLMAALEPVPDVIKRKKPTDSDVVLRGGLQNAK